MKTFIIPLHKATDVKRVRKLMLDHGFVVNKPYKFEQLPEGIRVTQ